MKNFSVMISATAVALLLLISQSAYSQGAKPAGTGLDHRIASMPLSDVNTRDLFARALSDGEMPGGIVVAGTCGQWPTQNFPQSQPTLRELLDGIVTSEPEYSWTVDDGVVNLLPRADEPLLFDLRIPKFEVAEFERPNQALDRLMRLPSVRDLVTAELGAQLLSRGGLYPYYGDGPQPEKKKYSVSVVNVTVREALNAIAGASETGVWMFSQHDCHDGTRKSFALDFGGL